MDIHLSEEEQVEALKKWWKENGKSVVAGVVLGLGAVFGWQYWNKHQQQLAEQASLQFEKMNQSVQAGSPAAVVQAEALITDHTGSPYAIFAALDLAKVKFQQGDLAGAKAQLQWALDNSDDTSLQQIARLRLARLMLDAGELDQAALIVGQAPLDNFRGDFAELRGDIALRQGDSAVAREAYAEALEYKVSNPALVQMKHDDLAAVAE